MKERNIRVLEFDRIAERLAGMAESEPGSERCLDIRPSKDIQQIESLQQQTA
jgi:dsDNA-specific endonuclease/ATPase MutS2